MTGTVQPSTGMRAWFRSRMDAVRAQVRVYDLLVEHGVRLKYGGTRPEQISCPFHGEDRHPSARYHPEVEDQPEGVWCWVCRVRRDCLDCWKAFEQFEGNLPKVLRAMERAYGITPPEPPEATEEWAWVEADTHVDLPRLFAVCETRLRASRTAFDLRGYLTMGHVMDTLAHAPTRSHDDVRVVEYNLRQLLDKIREKEIACVPSISTPWSVDDKPSS